MTERDRGLAIAMLAEAFSVKELSSARIRILEQALRKVPVALLEPMVQRAIATRKPRWGDVPTVAELLEDAEYCRMEKLQALSYDGCCECEEHKGWREFQRGVADGREYMTVERCPCWKRHQEKVAALGMGSSPLALPAGSEERE